VQAVTVCASVPDGGSVNSGIAHPLAWLFTPSKAASFGHALLPAFWRYVAGGISRFAARKLDRPPQCSLHGGPTSPALGDCFASQLHQDGADSQPAGGVAQAGPRRRARFSPGTIFRNEAETLAAGRNVWSGRLDDAVWIGDAAHEATTGQHDRGSLPGL